MLPKQTRTSSAGRSGSTNLGKVAGHHYSHIANLSLCTPQASETALTSGGLQLAILQEVLPHIPA